MQNITSDEVNQCVLTKLRERLDRLENPKKWAKLDAEAKKWLGLGINGIFKKVYETKIKKLIPEGILIIK